MKPMRLMSWAVLGVAFGFMYGCRAHPGSLAMMVVGDAVHNADVGRRQEELAGQGPAAADEMFGSRVETLIDTRKANRELLVYPVKGDLLGASRFVAEVSDGKITALTRTKQNIDGVEDAIKTAGLRKKLIGKKPAACREEGEFGAPVLTLRNANTGNLVRVYDVRNWTNLRGARYCVLRFDSNDICKAVNLVGVSASTKKDPTKG